MTQKSIQQSRKAPSSSLGDRTYYRKRTGQTWFKQRFGLVQYQLKTRKPGQAVLPILWADVVRQRRFFIVNGLVIAATSAVGLWWVWFALWLLPRATWNGRSWRSRAPG